MSLSDSIPKARITINNGMGLRTLGILTTILLFVIDSVGATTLTESVRIVLRRLQKQT